MKFLTQKITSMWHPSTALTSFPFCSLSTCAPFSPQHKQEGWGPKEPSSLTIALSWELLACVIPRMLVVCITSTEKLGSQLAIREPKDKKSQGKSGMHARSSQQAKYFHMYLMQAIVFPQGTYREFSLQSSLRMEMAGTNQWPLLADAVTEA